MKWSLAVNCVNFGLAAWPFTLSAIYTFHCAQQLVVPFEQVFSITVVSFEFPARFVPNHTTATCPLASAATQGNTFDFLTVAPRLSRSGAVLHVVAKFDEAEKKILRLSDQAA